MTKVKPESAKVAMTEPISGTHDIVSSSTPAVHRDSLPEAIPTSTPHVTNAAGQEGPAARTPTAATGVLIAVLIQKLKHQILTSTERNVVGTHGANGTQMGNRFASSPAYLEGSRIYQRVAFAKEPFYNYAAAQLAASDKASVVKIILLDATKIIQCAPLFGQSFEAPLVRDVVMWLVSHSDEVASHATQLDLYCLNASLGALWGSVSKEKRTVDTCGKALFEFLSTTMVDIVLGAAQRGAFNGLKGETVEWRSTVTPFCCLGLVADAAAVLTPSRKLVDDLLPNKVQAKIKELTVRAISICEQYGALMDISSWVSVMSALTKPGLPGFEPCQIFKVVEPLMVQALAVPSLEDQMKGISDGVAKSQQLLARPGDIAHLLSLMATLGKLTGSGGLQLDCGKAVEALAPLVPNAARKLSPRDYCHLLAVITRVKAIPQLSKHLDSNLLERMIDQTRPQVFRFCSQGLFNIFDVSSYMSHTSRWKINVPLDVLDVICDRYSHCLQSHTSVRMQQLVYFLQGLEGHCSRHTKLFAAQDAEAWRWFLNGKVQTVVQLTARHTKSLLAVLQENEAVAMMTAVAKLNTPHTIDLYTLLSPLIASAVQTATLREINNIIEVLDAVSAVTTSTYAEEVVIQGCQKQREDVLKRSVHLCKSAPAQDFVAFLITIVDSVGQRQANHSTASPEVPELLETPLVDGEDDKGGVVTTVVYSSLANTLHDIILPEIASRVASQCNSVQVGELARALSKILRLKLVSSAETSASVDQAIRAIVLRSTFGFSAITCPQQVTRQSTKDQVLFGPGGSHWAFDFNCVTSLIMRIKRLSNEPEEDLITVFLVALRRIPLVIDNLQSNNIKQLAFFLSSCSSSTCPLLDYQTTAAAELVIDAIDAILDKIPTVAGALTLADIAALVASLQGMKELQHLYSDVLANECEGTSPHDEPASGSDSDDPLDVDANEESSDTEKWTRPIQALADRVVVLVNSTKRRFIDSSKSAPPALKSQDWKWIIRILQGLAELNSGGDEVKLKLTDVFYSVLPFLQLHATTLSPLELSLALNAFAKGGVWNVRAMQGLVAAACDGIAAAAPRQSISLLNTAIRSGFIQPNTSFGPTKRSAAISEGNDVTPLVIKAVGRLASLCASTADMQAVLGYRDVLQLLAALTYFSLPPRPMMDMCFRVAVQYLQALPEEQRRRQQHAFVLLLSSGCKLKDAAEQSRHGQQLMNCIYSCESLASLTVNCPLRMIGTYLAALKIGLLLFAESPAHPLAAVCGAVELMKKNVSLMNWSGVCHVIAFIAEVSVSEVSSRNAQVDELLLLVSRCATLGSCSTNAAYSILKSLSVLYPSVNAEPFAHRVLFAELIDVVLANSKNTDERLVAITCALWLHQGDSTATGQHLSMLDDVMLHDQRITFSVCSWFVRFVQVENEALKCIPRKIVAAVEKRLIDGIRSEDRTGTCLVDVLPLITDVSWEGDKQSSLVCCQLRAMLRKMKQRHLRGLGVFYSPLVISLIIGDGSRASIVDAEEKALLLQGLIDQTVNVR